MLEALIKNFDTVTMQRIERAVMARLLRYMPFVVVLLFVTGGLLFDLRCNGIRCIGNTRYGWFLLAKVVAALSVLVVFVNAVWAESRGRMSACRLRNTHRVVLALMAIIVFLAKTMFYL